MLSVATGNSPNRQDTRDRILGLSLVLLTLLPYHRVLFCDFVSIDDHDYVYGNPQVKSGLTWAGLHYAWTAIAVGNWHPLTILSYMLESQLFGAKPWVMHFTNLGFHVVNTVLVYVFAYRVLLQPKSGLISRGTSSWTSWNVAALFALHPLHVESVAWVSERKDVLSVFFALLSLLAYLNYSAKPSARNFCWVFAWLLLGLLCKPMLVTLPFVFLLLDHWPLARLRSKLLANLPLVLEKIPLFALVFLFSLTTLNAQREATVALEHLPLMERFQTVSLAYFWYLEKTFAPTRLAVLYLWLPSDHVGWWAGLSAGSLLLATLALAMQRTRPFLLVGWLWFLGTLVPVIGIVQVGNQWVADRYVYLPHIGLFLAISVAGAQAASRSTWALRVGVPLMIVIHLVLGLLTWQQIGHWLDSEALFRNVLSVQPDNFVAKCSLGSALADKGDPEAGLPLALEALAESGPQDQGTHHILAHIYRLLAVKTGDEEHTRKFVEHWFLAHPDKPLPKREK
jgi:hypothetical protein